MELPSQEAAGEMPIPINSISTYGGGHGQGHMIHHDPAPHNNHIIAAAAAAAAAAPQIPSNGPMNSSASLLEDSHATPTFNCKRIVKYRECLKNHAAAMGGNATDGCGEFMPSGEEGTLDALTCSACNCHRNFHRKEVEGEQLIASPYECYPHHLNRVGRKLIVGHHHHHHKQQGILSHESFGYHSSAGALITSRAAAAQPHQMIMSSFNFNNMGSHLPSESDEHEDNGGGVAITRTPHQMMKKRFRTKFTPEQKEKMLQFAEKVGWKIQKQEESVVQQFCQEVGVKRRVLKVWMHNNKHSLAKKINSSNNNNNNSDSHSGHHQSQA